MTKNHDLNLPFEDFIKQPSREKNTPVIYRGGKSSLANWVIPYFPPHGTFVDVFGGGGGITFAKGASKVDVYNDIGNVSHFMEVLRDFGDDLYKRLYLAPWSREFFHECFEMKKYIETETSMSWIDMEEEERIQWAFYWYVCMMQSFRHEEDDDSWFVGKGANSAKNFRHHTDDLPHFVNRLKNVIIEHKDFKDIINTYDSPGTLFYCDPPYVADTWEQEKGGYRNVMDDEEHINLLTMLNHIKGQAVLSGYPSDLYDNFLRGWKRVTKTRQGGIKNSSQEASERTEVLWIWEHHEGLWTSVHEIKPPSDVARVLSEEADSKAIAFFRERNGLQ